MSVDHQPTAFGRIFPAREDWLARAPVEEILEPELAIVDTHHHLWSERGRYLVEELLADTGTGHNIEATVFIECRTNYRTDGPIEMRSVGEVEFVANLASQCDAEHRGKTRVAAGIVGFADLTLGDRVEPILAALTEAGNGRFRGVRNNAGWHEDPVIGNNHHGAGAGHYLRADFRTGLNRLAAMGLSLDALVYHHQHADLIDLARACPSANIIMNHTGMLASYEIERRQIGARNVEASRHASRGRRAWRGPGNPIFATRRRKVPQRGPISRALPMSSSARATR